MHGIDLSAASIRACSELGPKSQLGAGPGSSLSLQATANLSRKALVQSTFKVYALLTRSTSTAHLAFQSLSFNLRARTSAPILPLLLLLGKALLCRVLQLVHLLFERILSSLLLTGVGLEVQEEKHGSEVSSNALERRRCHLGVSQETPDGC